MDANGLRFWMLANEGDWSPLNSAAPGITYDARKNRLRLESDTNTAAPAENQTQAQSLLRIAPMAADGFGGRAWWDASMGHVMATGALPGAVPIYTPADGQSVTDVCMGFDGILYLAVANQVVFVDRRNRWDPVTLSQPGFNFYRLAAHPDGGVWALNDLGATLVRVQGEPLPNLPVTPMAANAFDYADPNRNPPRVTATNPVPAGERAVAIAADPTGAAAILSWIAGKPAGVRRLSSTGKFSPSQVTGNLEFPYSFAFLDAQTVAVLATGSAETLVFNLGDLTTLPKNPPVMLPSGTPYPLPGFVSGPFLHGVTQPPQFPTSTGGSPLYPLSFATYARSAWVENGKVLDSGKAGATWHRIYLEASIPSGCAVRVLLAASDKRLVPGGPNNAVLAWWEHRFGAQYVWSGGGASNSIPTGAWAPQTSEIPFHPGLLGCSQSPNKGLFTALVQRGGCSVQITDTGAPSSIRTGTAVRALRGRYLAVRVQLIGNGRSTPEIAALRVYGSRFSYVANYLPALFKEWTFGPDADVAGDSTRPDFLERFIDNFEGILTVMEDRVASAYLVTSPRTAADESLDWLASWIGLTFDPVWPKDRRRSLIEVAPQLYRLHGTLQGLELALDTATKGLQSTGAVLVVEDYRLRRTFATILGADFGNQTNPLLPDLTHSGNSFVGGTLFLGSQALEEFLAIYAPVMDESPAEQSAVQKFYRQLANRVTVFVHKDVAGQDLGLIQRVVDIERPAHVVSRIVPASAALLIGIASLLGVDTFLTEKPPTQPVRVQTSDIGRLDVIRHLPSLDPRLESGLSSADFQAPIAQLSASTVVAPGGSITLDASASQPGPERTITGYSWTVEITS